MLKEVVKKQPEMDQVKIQAQAVSAFLQSFASQLL